MIDSTWLVLTTVGAMIVVAFVVASFEHVADKKRTADVQQVARKMGFEFSPSCTSEELERVAGGLPVFGRGHSKRAARVMRGTLAGREAAILDYRYATGGGKSSHTYRHTIVVLPDGARFLPDFTLAPEHVLHRIAGAFGFQDIDFPAYLDFSKHYLLRGADEGAIRAAFSSQVLAFLEGKTGWHVQASGGRLAIFREGRYAEPEQFASYAADTLRIAETLETRDT
jgi:hypothetical protein